MTTSLTPPAQQTPTDDVIAATRLWLERTVIGLNLCPFAKAVYVREQIRYVASTATDIDTLLGELATELMTLQAADPAEIDTTLLIVPCMLHDFMDYNDFLYLADTEVSAAGLQGILQIASFHPAYQFADTAIDDIENFTNRSPYPTLHLLRESSIDRAVASFPEAEEIYEKNIQTMRNLGIDGWRALGLPLPSKG